MSENVHYIIILFSRFRTKGEHLLKLKKIKLKDVDTMDNPIDKRGKLDGDIFSYRVTKDKKVFISWFGKIVTTLNGSKAENFISDIENIDGTEAQLIMARVTGHFKHGNEKSNKKRK